MTGQTATNTGPLVITPVRDLPEIQWPDGVDVPVFWDWYLTRFDHEREADS